MLPRNVFAEARLSARPNSPERGPRPMKKCWSAALLALALTMTAAPAASQAASGFADTNPMSVERVRHTATLLPNGEVLVVGGQDEDNISLASAELFDPASETWTMTEPLPEPRQNHTATLLPSGRVMVIGGTGNAVDQGGVAVYDAATGTWGDGPPLPVARADHTTTLLPGAKLLVAGGAIGTAPTDTAFLLDLKTGNWTPTANTMSAQRRFPEAALLPDGRVLIAGGVESGFTATATADVYDPATNSFTEVDSMDFPRANFATAVLPDGRVLASGGYEEGWGNTSQGAEAFDPATESWSPVSEPFLERGEAAAVTLESGNVLFVEWDDTGEVFDFDSGDWEDVPNTMVGERVGMANARLGDGRVLLTGGCDCTFTYPTAQIYTPMTRSTADDLDFGDQPVEQRSPSIYTTVENTGNEALWTDGLAIVGDDSADFTVFSESCTERRIPPGGRCTIGVQIRPAATGARFAVLELQDNSAGGSTQLFLSGIGVAPAQGPKGDQGDPGAPGTPGAQGPQGVPGTPGTQGLQGAQGATGAEGKAGAKGDKGDRGEKGDTGPQGPAGAAAKVTCTSKVKPAKAKSRVFTTCKVTFAQPLSRTARVHLSADGETVAAGTLRKGKRFLTLTVPGELVGPYAVTLRR
jgi:hypothetical protein